MGLFDCGIHSSCLTTIECKGSNANKDFDEISEFYSVAKDMDEEDDNDVAAMSGLYSLAQDNQGRHHAAGTRRIEDDLDAALVALNVGINTGRNAMYNRHDQEIDEKLNQFLQAGAQTPSAKASAEKVAESLRNPQAQPSCHRNKKERQQPTYIRIFCRLQEHSSFVVFGFERKGNNFIRLVNAIGLKLLGKASPGGSLYLMRSANESIEVGDIQTIRDEDRFVFVPFEPEWIQKHETPTDDREQPLQDEMHIQDYSLVNHHEEHNVDNLEEEKTSTEEPDPISSSFSLSWDQVADDVVHKEVTRSICKSRSKAKTSRSQSSKQNPSSVAKEVGVYHMDRYEHADHQRGYNYAGHCTRESTSHHQEHQYDDNHQEHQYDTRKESSGRKAYKSRDGEQDWREAPI